MKKLRAGVVGAGYLGRFHAQKYAGLENVELVGVADVVPGRAGEVAAETGTTPYTDYRELIGRVDAVSVVTPTSSHLEVGRAFLREGVNVLIEKPIAVTPLEADALIEEAERTGAVLQVGHLERFNPAVVALKGRVKNPMFIESHRLSPFPDRSTDVDVVLDLMIHDIDIILSLVGSEVESVDATGVPLISGKVDIASARLRFENGCVANVTASRVSKERQRRIRLFQHDAYIAIDYAAQHISISRLTHPDGSARPVIVEEELDIVKGDSLREEIKSFIECSLAGTSPLVGGRDGKRALEVARKIQEATRRSLAVLRDHLEGVDAAHWLKDAFI